MDNTNVQTLKRKLLEKGLSQEIVNSIDIEESHSIDRPTTIYKLSILFGITEEVDNSIGLALGHDKLFNVIASKAIDLFIAYLAKNLPQGQVIGDRIVLSLAEYERLRRRSDRYMPSPITDAEIGRQF